MFWLSHSNTNMHLNTTVMTQLEMDTFLMIFFQFGAYAVSDITDMIQGVCAAVDAFVVYSLFLSTFSCPTVLSLLAFALPHNHLLYFQ